MATNREYLGEQSGYHVYKMHDGMMEGWRKGQRYVTNATTIEGFLAQVPKVRTKKPKEAKPEVKK